ncbi:hypothetical protein GEMRC1_009968 [Eukaryota sp. GEM-RC1]
MSFYDLYTFSQSIPLLKQLSTIEESKVVRSDMFFKLSLVHYILCGEFIKNLDIVPTRNQTLHDQALKNLSKLVFLKKLERYLNELRSLISRFVDMEDSNAHLKNQLNVLEGIALKLVNFISSPSEVTLNKFQNESTIFSSLFEPPNSTTSLFQAIVASYPNKSFHSTVVDNSFSVRLKLEGYVNGEKFNNFIKKLFDEQNIVKSSKSLKVNDSGDDSTRSETLCSKVKITSDLAPGETQSTVVMLHSENTTEIENLLFVNKCRGTLDSLKIFLLRSILIGIDSLSIYDSIYQ